MTNRIEYAGTIEQTGIEADMSTIATILTLSKMDLTLGNAETVLRKGLANKPQGWTITVIELWDRWEGFTKTINCPFCQSPIGPTNEEYRTCPACGAHETEPGCCGQPFFEKDDPDRGMVHYACLCGREQASDSYIDLHGPMSVAWGGV